LWTASKMTASKSRGGGLPSYHSKEESADFSPEHPRPSAGHLCVSAVIRRVRRYTRMNVDFSPGHPRPSADERGLRPVRPPRSSL
jgi:hypothetical protein